VKDAHEQHDASHRALDTATKRLPVRPVHFVSVVSSLGGRVPAPRLSHKVELEKRDAKRTDADDEGRNVNPHLLVCMASYDVASTIQQSDG